MLIKEIGGLKVGIFGLSTPETATKANPKFFAGYVFQDAVETAKKCVDALKEAGCHYIICLGHIGMDEESPVTSTDITDAVEGIDLFIDGHSHTKLENGKVNNGTLIVSTGEYLKHVGVVKVTFRGIRVKSQKAWLIQSSDENYPLLPEHPATKKRLAYYTDYARQLSEQVVGQTAEELIGEREYVRKQQTNLGSLITDAMRIMTDSDIAITNGGGIRATISAGDITYNDILTVLPFGNWVVVKKMTGADILTVLEESVANYPNLAGGYMHVSGIAFTFDARKPAGARIDPADVTVGGRPMDLAAIYTVATNNFLADGGDGSSLGKGSIFGEYGPMDQMLLEYMQEYGCVYEPGDRVTAIE
jgi:2',3'-cyclic-nucleotide 2'-phosphodiesterase (5'-nucleotidase family)